MKTGRDMIKRANIDMFSEPEATINLSLLGPCEYVTKSFERIL